ncbi:MAG: hypothetical protein L3K01_02560 [Thermoplasmata archaeon]|nr:hypothetical protein [Thermoplasmata archaeon]
MGHSAGQNPPAGGVQIVPQLSWTSTEDPVQDAEDGTSTSNHVPEPIFVVVTGP